MDASSMNFHVDVNGRGEEVIELAFAIKHNWTESSHVSGRYLSYMSLAYGVLAVAVVWPEVLDFKVYVKAVNGKNYDEEQFEAHATGDKQLEAVSRTLFPSLEGFTYGKY